MPKKKLLVILGAGSSVAQKMPSVSELNGKMLGWSADWARIYRPATNFFDQLWKNAQAYYDLEPKALLRKKVQFEKVLGDLVALANWMRPGPHGETLRQLVAPGLPSPAPPGLVFDYHGVRIKPGVGFFEHGIVNANTVYLLRELAIHMRQRSRSINVRSPAFSSYAQLMGLFRKKFSVGIYNLNYDVVAMKACPGASSGFNSFGRFCPADVHSRKNWDFVYHLHGSVHHSLADHGQRLEWRDDLSVDFDDGSLGMSGKNMSDGRSRPKTTLIAGGWKLDQLQSEPYQTFYSSLVRHAYEADAIVLGGYGFGDLHLNTAIRNRMTGVPGRPPVLVLSKADDPTEPLQWRNDEWAIGLASTLSANTHSFAMPGHSAPSAIDEINAADSFEVSPNSDPPVAVWYKGFETAVTRGNDIVNWLLGDRTALG
jgi:hypothetical protein